jgi:hypothetical protein
MLSNAHKEDRYSGYATYSPDLAQVPWLNPYYFARPLFELLPKTAPELLLVPKSPPK